VVVHMGPTTDKKRASKPMRKWTAEDESPNSTNQFRILSPESGQIRKNELKHLLRLCGCFADHKKPAIANGGSAFRVRESTISGAHPNTTCFEKEGEYSPLAMEPSGLSVFRERGFRRAVCSSAAGGDR
jgi:hypothetical protein